MQTYGNVSCEGTDSLSLNLAGVWKSFMSRPIGNDDNDRTDSLIKRGTELRFKLMGLQSPDWFQTELTLY